MIRLKAPVTACAAGAGVVGTWLLASRPEWWGPWTTWMVHTDARHLACDVGAVALVGAWIEARVGWRRMALWVAAGLMASNLVHGVVYAGQAGLFGLSAVSWTVALAGATAAGLGRMGVDRRWGWAWMGASGALLGYELMSGGRSVMAELGAEVARAWPLVQGMEMTPVPVVHAACAGLGVVMGAAGGLAERGEVGCDDAGDEGGVLRAGCVGR